MEERKSIIHSIVEMTIVRRGHRSTNGKLFEVVEERELKFVKTTSVRLYLDKTLG
jgi:hypothetical protein